MKISIDLSEEEIKILRKRADKNLLTLREQVEDIVRRSCINYKRPRTFEKELDDKLISIFSRQKK